MVPIMGPIQILCTRALTELRHCLLRLFRGRSPCFASKKRHITQIYFVSRVKNRAKARCASDDWFNVNFASLCQCFLSTKTMPQHNPCRRTSAANDYHVSVISIRARCIDCRTYDVFWWLRSRFY